MFPKDYTMKDHEYANERTTALIEMTSKFCGEYLDDDYKHLCSKMIEKIATLVARSGPPASLAQHEVLCGLSAGVKSC